MSDYCFNCGKSFRGKGEGRISRWSIAIADWATAAPPQEAEKPIIERREGVSGDMGGVGHEGTSQGGPDGPPRGLKNDSYLSVEALKKFDRPGHGWKWQSVCTECAWETPPGVGLTARRGPLLKGEVRK